ncbi:hypothetical protein DM02DRAFT_251115 [Periconia macrospinosa]|uniref:Uncharacterized protein n=1 Tax=Periconia macrospinosa TaxID=97972 RepID=A0A2V1DZ14_9PLEO|nr:hypothetical protein DM02DRAFT_251115 [Periconia macrospinosa]
MRHFSDHSTPKSHLCSRLLLYSIPFLSMFRWTVSIPRIRRVSPPLQVPRKRNCKSSGLRRSMATLSLLTVPAIMAAFFSCSATIRDSTLSSMHSRVITQGRFCPMR